MLGVRCGSDDGLIRLGRIGFRLHSVAVLGIIVTLFTMLFRHWFEYDYVWKHSNLQMPMRYIRFLFLGRTGRLLPAVDLLACGARHHSDPRQR